MRDTIRMRLPWEPFGVTILGDPHIDAPSHNRALLLRDLDKAVENGDSVWIIGDVWSFILPRDLKRYTEGRHGQKRDAIINHALNDAFELFKPYADVIDIMLLGNHEAEVIRRHHIDPLLILIDRLNQVKTSGRYRDADGNARIAHAGYTAWVQLRFAKTTGKRPWSISNTVWLHHGKGGGAPVTKGMIDSNRIRVARFADVYAIGHKHTSIHDSARFEHLDSYGNRKVVWQDFVIVGGYSGEDSDADDYEADGYTMDYSAEQHYGLEAQGSKRIIFTPGSQERSRKSYPHIRRRVEQETA